MPASHRPSPGWASEQEGLRLILSSRLSEGERVLSGHPQVSSVQHRLYMDHTDQYRHITLISMVPFTDSVRNFTRPSIDVCTGQYDCSHCSLSLLALFSMHCHTGQYEFPH